MDPRDTREPWPRPETDGMSLTGIMAFVRARCPWASAHTHATLARYLVEESAELLAAEEQLYAEGQLREPGAEAGPGQAQRVDAVEGEIADLLYQVLFHSALLDDHGGRAPGETFERVERRLAAKLVRRHPHVFESAHPVPLDRVQEAYSAVKAEEKRTGASAPEPPRAAGERAVGLMRRALGAAEHKLLGTPETDRGPDRTTRTAEEDG
jgi:NTP pyrophosphatase (non-canonical NTP hydrolase)